MSTTRVIFAFVILLCLTKSFCNTICCLKDSSNELDLSILFERTVLKNNFIGFFNVNVQGARDVVGKMLTSVRDQFNVHISSAAELPPKIYNYRHMDLLVFFVSKSFDVVSNFISVKYYCNSELSYFRSLTDS